MSVKAVLLTINTPRYLTLSASSSYFLTVGSAGNRNLGFSSVFAHVSGNALSAARALTVCILLDECDVTSGLKLFLAICNTLCAPDVGKT